MSLTFIDLETFTMQTAEKLLGLNKKNEGGWVEYVGALVADVRADEPNERQVVEVLYKAIMARWVRWTLFYNVR